MKQKKLGDILYVFQVTPYEITEDTDVSVIKVQLESYDGFVELNESLASKFVKYNYEMFTVRQQEWAPYVDAKEVPDLAWSSDSATATVGETNTYPTLTNTDNVDVTYSSSDTSVATIASDGTITLLEAGTTTISAVFAGDSTYVAKTVSYSLTVTPHDYSTDYLTTKALGSGDISFSGSGASYRKNNGEWANYTEAIPVVKDDVIEWKGTITSTISSIGTIGSTGNIDAYGNVMSMLFGDNFVNQTDLTGKAAAFENLFKDNNHLINAENLILPATTLAPSCYNQMFSKCASLTTAPELPATTLSQNCYYQMFNSCTSLTTAPELPATTLAPSCYNQMFRSCTLLNNVTCLATDISASNCINSWLTNTAASGTFIKDPNMTGWVVGTNVPSGWTIEDYSE